LPNEASAKLGLPNEASAKLGPVCVLKTLKFSQRDPLEMSKLQDPALKRRAKS
jgi:hypothetical protein